MQAANQRMSTLFIDLDGTLYPNNNGMWDAIAGRMNTYMHEVLKLPAEEIPSLRLSYFQRYGTTLRGLQANHEVDPHHFLAYVHDIPTSEFLSPDRHLSRMLASLGYSKWILTNSDQAHSRRVLDALGVSELFDGIIDVTALEFRNKPEPEAFRKALHLAGDPAPGSCIFIDDLPKNLAPAKVLGLHTILVGQDHNAPEIDQTIPNIYSLPAAVAQIERRAASDV